MAQIQPRPETASTDDEPVQRRAAPSGQVAADGRSAPSPSATSATEAAPPTAPKVATTGQARRPSGAPAGPSAPSEGQPSLSQIAQSQAASAIPERPALAPGVNLAGQMQESAFEDPPWLI